MLTVRYAPEVPFCTAVRMALAVVLARYSVPEWVRSIDDSGAVGGAHSTDCRRSSVYSAARAGALPACSSCCARNESSLSQDPSFRAFRARRIDPSRDGAGA